MQQTQIDRNDLCSSFTFTNRANFINVFITARLANTIPTPMPGPNTLNDDNEIRLEWKVIRIKTENV